MGLQRRRTTAGGAPSEPAEPVPQRRRDRTGRRPTSPTPTPRRSSGCRRSAVAGRPSTGPTPPASSSSSRGSTSAASSSHPTGRPSSRPRPTWEKLWRFSLRSAKVSEVDTRGADLVDADGLILWGHLLIVVRNFSKRLSTLRLDDRARTARQLKDVPTDPDRSSPPPRSPEADCSWSTASSTSRRIRSSPSH